MALSTFQRTSGRKGIARSLEHSCNLIATFAPFLASLLPGGVGVGSTYLLRAKYSNEQIAEEHGAAGLLLIATTGSFILAFLALAIAAYTTLVCWLMPA